MFLIGGGMWGCALFNKLPVHFQESGSQYYDDGMKAFQGGDYGKALKLFETLSKEVKNETLRHNSLYALTCIRLIRAKDADQFNNAMISWEDWSHLVPIKMDTEDPRMLEPLLESVASLHLRADCKEKKKGKAVNDEVSKKLLHVKEKKIEELLKSLDRKKNQIEELTHQIEALETIHREIQKKKKEVSSP